MGRLTKTSDIGGVAFTFDLDITCKPSEAQKILKMAEKLKGYEDIIDDPEKLKLIDALYLEKCEEINRLKDDLAKVNKESKTRIEHIRSMSVEELADAILERSEISTTIDFCQNFCGECENIPESECRKCLIKYLNSPVEQKKVIPTQHFENRFNKVT